MSRTIHYFDDPERFVVGTIGMPGERTFYLQARDGTRTISVALEKSQVAELADRLGDVLASLEVEPPQEADTEPLDLPVDEEFRVGSLMLSWNPTHGRLIIEAHAMSEAPHAKAEDDDPDAADTLRVRLAPERLAAFVERAHALVAAGRPPCPICQQPLDPSGHICPRANGYRRRA